MIWEDNYLAHYGIVGQRWGVRRFQNSDGTLTAEGKKRYSVASKERFATAVKKVQHSSSNRLEPFKREPINVAIVQERGKVSKGEAQKCIELADQIFKRAAEIEPQITKDVISCVENSGGDMYGLQYRLKQPSSIASKIGADAKEKEISFAEAAASMKDAIRYTSISNEKDFVKNYLQIKDSLGKKGYHESRCRNYFQQYKEGKARHKAVQCVYIDQNGHQFELQFQTPGSQAVKELKIPLYEERRKSGLSNERKSELEQQMIDLAEMVSDPKDISRILSHG